MNIITNDPVEEPQMVELVMVPKEEWEELRDTVRLMREMLNSIDSQVTPVINQIKSNPMISALLGE